MDFTGPRFATGVGALEDARCITCTDERTRQPFDVHVVQDGLIVGDAYPVCVVVREGRNAVLVESSDYHPWASSWGEMAFADERNAEVVGELDEACCLSLPHNLCHLYQETIPKVCIMERMGYSGHYVVADVPMLTESLEIIGIEQTRIHPAKPGSLRVSRLHVPQSLPLAYGHLYPAALWDARLRCLAAADPSMSTPRLFIGRSQQTHRHIVGEEAFLEFLAEYGFRSVRMEEFTLRQQIGLTSAAKIVIGPHGAGIANTLFMKEHGLVLEMFSPHYINSCVLPICRLLNLGYFPIVSQVNPVGAYAYGENILPDTDLIRFYFDRHII